MPDREKVLKGMECCLNFGDCQKQCNYFPDHGCDIELMHDALELLKAQEQIVRCKDCKHGELTKNARDEVVIKCEEICWLCRLPRLMEPDWFCADGERRE